MDKLGVAGCGVIRCGVVWCGLTNLRILLFLPAIATDSSMLHSKHASQNRTCDLKNSFCLPYVVFRLVRI